MLNSFNPTSFRTFVNNAINERRVKVESTNNLMVDIRTDFQTAFQNTQLLGGKCAQFLKLLVRRGRGADLLKVTSKRRKTKVEKEQAELDESLKGDQVALLEIEINTLKAMLNNQME